MNSLQINPDVDAIRVLAIEDNPDDAFVLRRALHKAGDHRFTLQVVEKLAEGLDQLNRAPYDVVLLDLSLPDSTGLETVRRTIESGSRSTAVVVLSHNDDERTAIQAVACGAQDYVTKGSIDGKLLARVIRYAMMRRSMQIELEDQEFRFRQFVEKHTDGILFVDLDGIVQYANPAAEAMFGQDARELIGRPMQVPRQVTQSPDDPMADEEHLEHTITTNMHLLDTLWEGRSVSVVTMHDITERKELEQQRDRLAGELEQTRAQLAQVRAQCTSQAAPALQAALEHLGQATGMLENADAAQAAGELQTIRELLTRAAAALDTSKA